ncbi:MAG: NAD(P)-binding protein, partial [Eggerthellaceae bacterium]|nr:NAD(P)-binding protein [Eggerthellaceae bacterium]
MGKPGAYLSVRRREHDVRPAVDAVQDFDDIVVDLPSSQQREQASRCMNCGVPFCQSGIRFEGARQATGCPLHNLIPETNDLLFHRRWDDAVGRLSLTNPFPEFTGRVCPAPCEVACNLGLHDDAVTIHDNERSLSDYAWEHGMKPLPAATADAPLVSVIGSGPAGLAAAWELARRGLRVRVY